MSDRLIASDAPLGAEQRALLGALVDTIVPESDDGRMPSARELDFADYLDRNAPDFRPELAGVLAYFDPGFVTQPLSARYERVKDFSEEAPDTFNALLAQVYGCYYQDNRVPSSSGSAPARPFRRATPSTPATLSLLDPVLKNPTRWRRRELEGMEK